jgi:hypothetical protein
MTVLFEWNRYTPLQLLKSGHRDYSNVRKCRLGTAPLKIRPPLNSLRKSPGLQIASFNSDYGQGDFLHKAFFVSKTSRHLNIMPLFRHPTGHDTPPNSRQSPPKHLQILDLTSQYPSHLQRRINQFKLTDY